MNTVVSVASLASASAVAAPNLLREDPIFSVIEQHKLAALRDMEAGDIRMSTVDAPWAPEYDAAKVQAAEAANQEAGVAVRSAAIALIDTRPTTISGLLALLDYIEFFNAGGIKLPSDPDGWSSSPIFWPHMKDKNSIEMFGFAVLGNVRRSLQMLNGSAPSPDVIQSLLKNDDEDVVEAEAKPPAEPKPDPVFKAIERHAKARRRFHAALKILAEVEIKTDFGSAGPDALKQMRQARMRESRTSDQCLAAELALLQTRPETAVGQVAWIRYVRGIIFEDRNGSLEQARLEPFAATVEDLLTPGWLLRLEDIQAARAAA